MKSNGYTLRLVAIFSFRPCFPRRVTVMSLDALSVCECLAFLQAGLLTHRAHQWWIKINCLSPELGLRWRMRILSLPTLRAFYQTPRYADAKGPLLAWHAHTLKANWLEPADVKADFGNASILKEGRVVFNIAGNKYRLVTSINYPYGIVFVRFIGTHKQYDAIDAQTI